MGPDTDSQNDGEHGEADEPTDEEQVETEWHFWLLAVLVAGGVVLVIFPLEILPGIGFVLIALAVVGWVFKTIIEEML